MNLYNIENAIRPQFVWLEHSSKRLLTTDKDNNGFGKLVFIGIANSYNIPESEIIEFLAIKRPEYDTKTNQFNEIWSVILSRKESGRLCIHYDHIDRVYLKTRLTLNALNFQFSGKTLHCALAI